MKAQLACLNSWGNGSLPFCFSVLVLLLATAGCSSSRQESAGKAPHAHLNHTNLEMDEGKKWVIVEPMMAHLRNLEGEVRNFDNTPQSNHSALAYSIQNHLALLVTNCTMEGKAHDELHKWLIPFLALSTDYIEASEAGEPLAPQRKLNEIKQALLVFNQHFE